MILVPVAGALVIVVMARHGSERIRGHGIPEAIEAILINGSRLDPKVAVLKPLSSAISIGSGGPFGAEGTIIMTGGDRIARRRGTKGGGTWSRAGKGRWARKSGRSGAALRRRGEVARRE